MNEINDLALFLERNRLDEATWRKSAIEWDVLQDIARDHLGQINRLSDAAELFARVIQRFPGVHSVRWRIKDKDNLLAKIIRKRAEGVEKYLGITPLNYFEIVTDLIGLRALHLFKDECFSLDGYLRNEWIPIENPVAYIRDGDPEDFIDRLRHHGFEVKKHPAGYRSVHYILSSQPLQRKVFAETQVRTIFEEGWSEIDHRVRYPNFSDDQHVSYFLTIFNRLAGSADEMGTFVRGLTEVFAEFKTKVVDANKQKEEAISAMDRALVDLGSMKRQDKDAKNLIDALQKEVAKIRSLSVLEGKYNELAASGVLGITAGEAVRSALGAAGGMYPSVLPNGLLGAFDESAYVKRITGQK